MAQNRVGPATDLRGRPALRDTHNMKFFMKLGCDHRLASAVIGAGEQKIKDMMNRSQTFIKPSKKGNWFPDTQCQLFLIGGPSKNFSTCINYFHKAPSLSIIYKGYEV